LPVAACRRGLAPVHRQAGLHRHQEDLLRHSGELVPDRIGTTPAAAGPPVGSRGSLGRRDRSRAGGQFRGGLLRWLCRRNAVMCLFTTPKAGRCSSIPNPSTARWDARSAPPSPRSAASMARSPSRWCSTGEAIAGNVPLPPGRRHRVDHLPEGPRRETAVRHETIQGRLVRLRRAAAHLPTV